MSQQDASNDDRIVDAVKKYMRLLDAGDAPSQTEYLKQHADIAKDLRPALEGLAIVHQFQGKPAAIQDFADVGNPIDEFQGKPIGDFQIVAEIGRGGMGVVYEAIQLSLNRRVALKVLPLASSIDEVRLQRFRNEAHAAAALHHTNIVPVYAVGSDRGVHYYAMQLINGRTIADLLAEQRKAESTEEFPATDDAAGTLGQSFESEKRDGDPRRKSKLNQKSTALQGQQTTKLGARQSTRLGTNATKHKSYYRSVVRMIHQAALAIEHAHQYGVIHRDLKPANLLQDSAGKIWVADFGLAQVQAEQSNLTRTGDPIGTLKYMSPEQAMGRRGELDHRTDIYSLGVTLYEMLTLRSAIEDGDYHEVLHQVTDLEPPAPKVLKPSLPIELDTIVRKAISKIPAERYDTAKAFADDLQAWLDDRPITARPPSFFERAAKWRRRYRGLVSAAGVLLCFVSIGLLVSSMLIWNQQRQTAEALLRETKQRKLAEQRFEQARLAVDTFSNLSESELASRDELQDLRRSFLVTSLSFYQDFLADKPASGAQSADLQATRDRVGQMVEDLQVLDNLSVLRAVSEERVQQEVNVSPESALAIEDAIVTFQTQRAELPKWEIGDLKGDNEALTALLRELNQAILERLSDEQMVRLRQIDRQRRLPFTFKSSEVRTELALTQTQIRLIDQLIVSGSPFRGGMMQRGGPGSIGGPRGGGFREAGGRSHHGPDDPRPAPSGTGQRITERQSPSRSGGLKRNGNPDWPPPRDPRHAEAIQATVDRIEAILNDEQLEIWKVLIGEPFDRF